MSDITGPGLHAAARDAQMSEAEWPQEDQSGPALWPRLLFPTVKRRQTSRQTAAAGCPPDEWGLGRSHYCYSTSTNASHQIRLGLAIPESSLFWWSKFDVSMPVKELPDHPTHGCCVLWRGTQRLERGWWKSRESRTSRRSRRYWAGPLRPLPKRMKAMALVTKRLAMVTTECILELVNSIFAPFIDCAVAGSLI